MNKFEQFQKKKTILRKITSARMDAGISMRAASHMTQKSGAGERKGEQISPSAWALIESGRRWPTWDSLFLMAKTLGLDIRVEVTSRGR